MCLRLFYCDDLFLYLGYSRPSLIELIRLDLGLDFFRGQQIDLRLNFSRMVVLICLLQSLGLVMFGIQRNILGIELYCITMLCEME